MPHQVIPASHLSVAPSSASLGVAWQVSECFTIPLYTLLDKQHWLHDEAHKTIVFTGGPHIIWGLTAYILDRFIKEVLGRYKIDEREAGLSSMRDAI
jgi:hypothetical protein